MYARLKYHIQCTRKPSIVYIQYLYSKENAKVSHNIAQQTSSRYMLHSAVILYNAKKYGSGCYKYKKLGSTYQESRACTLVNIEHAVLWMWSIYSQIHIALHKPCLGDPDSYTFSTQFPMPFPYTNYYTFSTASFIISNVVLNHHSLLRLKLKIDNEGHY